jgi:hypothetical protein
VGTTDYWVEICQNGSKLGAGFVVTRHYVITALHCLRGFTPDDEDLELSFPTGEVTPGRIYECAPDVDLALIDILKPQDKAPALPNADRARQGDAWFAPYRPHSDEPHLAGDVASGAMAYRCVAGYEIEALQLNCSQAIGDYSGYSGGPVERREGNGDPSLIGVLVEQHLDRQDSDRASGVLFAATMAEAVRRFDCLGVSHLMRILTAEDGTARERPAARKSRGDEVPESTRAPFGYASGPSAESRIAEARSLIDTFQEWGESKVLSPMQVSNLKWRTAQHLVDGKWASDV